MIFITLLTIISSANAEIGASSDLNCNFAGACRWSNSSDPAAPGKFVLTTRVEESSIMAREESNPTPFAYTSGLMGRTLALLVSEVVNCQLGGANIKYWYYKTGRESQLDVCIRQPPGNRDIQAMRCYDGSSTNYVNQWVLRTIELPPIGQPFEIVFKAIFIPPMDALAIDEISYEAMLCDTISRQRREIRRIGYRDWQEYRKSNVYNGELMLIVAQEVADELQNRKEMSTTEAPTTPETTTTTTTSTTTTTEPSTTTSEETSTMELSTEMTNRDRSQDFSNFLEFLKQSAPVLPYIPTLVRSLTSFDTNPVPSSHFYHTNPIEEIRTTSAPSNQFGLPIYPAKLVQKHITLAPLSAEELHRKIFSTTTIPPQTTQLIVYKQPSSGETDVAEKLADIAKQLSPSELKDLTALRDIPDIDGLIKGMDLSDIRRPGGFSRLKKQFIERLMRRTLGMPMETSNVKVLPPPIVPMKVTRRMMAEMAKRRRYS